MPVDPTDYYRAVFSSPEGRRVLEDLRQRFYDAPMSGDDLHREAGRRDVVHFILNLIGEFKHD